MRIRTLNLIHACGLLLAATFTPAQSPAAAAESAAKRARFAALNGAAPAPASPQANPAPLQPDATVTVALDPNANRRAINPDIYGVADDSTGTPDAFPYPVRRWGGNGATCYNWQQDMRCSAQDWFYFNYDYGHVGQALPDNGQANVFIDYTRSHSGRPLITLPMMGWTPKDQTRRWNYSVTTYGAQQLTECTYFGASPSSWPAWCNNDAGNGKRADGSAIFNNDPHDAMMTVDETFSAAWVGYLKTRYGTSAGGPLRDFALDNEPMLWSSTHQDARGTLKLGYDELWTRTRTYGAAAKAVDATIKLYGPVVWGWCAYFWSDRDGCGNSAGPDYSGHTPSPLLEWYLAQAKAYEQQTGKRLLDVLDIHYYPQSGNVALTTDESGATQALRLRSLKSLYDPNYIDESWINDKINLIPRMKDIINRNYPGTKFAITEYNWGDADAGISSALAQAEALALFGREGVDLATRWVMPNSNVLLEDAFKLYLNYDGAGHALGGDAAKAQSGAVDSLGSYAINGAGGQMILLLFNKATTATTASVTSTIGINGPLKVYGFANGVRLAALPDQTISAGATAFSVSLPALSARLLIGQYVCAAPTQPVSGFKLAKSGGNLRFTWNPLAGAGDYQVSEAAAANGAFGETGTSVSGATGLTTAMDLPTHFYRVTARTPCGSGPSN